MLVSDLVKWKRALNNVKFQHEELLLVKQLTSSVSSEFQLFFEKYCRQNEINLQALKSNNKASTTNHKNNEKLINDKEKEQDLGMSIWRDLGKPRQDAPQEIVDNKDKDQMKEVFVKLFRKLALHLHPDRIQGLSDGEIEERLELFKKAKESLDKEDYFILLEMSDRFQIRNPKNYKQQTRWMKQKAKQIEQQLRDEKRTYNFMFAEAETDEEKERLIKNFLAQVFNYRS
jgi:hypothetical protein